MAFALRAKRKARRFSVTNLDAVTQRWWTREFHALDFALKFRVRMGRRGPAFLAEIPPEALARRKENR